MKLPLNSSQTIAAVAITAALAAGAYALGRSQNALPSAPPLAAPTQQVAAAMPTSAPAAQNSPNAAPIPDSQPSPPSEQALCEGCSRVISVRTELRQAQTSGLGAVGGAVVGGLLGNRFGGGTGRKAMTLGGAVAGGLAGNAIEKRNAQSHRVWVVELADADGRTHRHEQASDPQLQAGDVASIRDGRLVRR